MQTGIEKNLFGNHPVSLPATEARGPPPAFASDPLMPTTAGGRENNSAKPSIIDIVEMDGPSSVNPSLSNHDSNFMKTASPTGVRDLFLLIITYIILQ